ncbi:MAG: hypothetical protein ABEK59_00030 [Halobacteria archaeon]
MTISYEDEGITRYSIITVALFVFVQLLALTFALSFSLGVGEVNERMAEVFKDLGWELAVMAVLFAAMKFGKLGSVYPVVMGSLFIALIIPFASILLPTPVAVVFSVAFIVLVYIYDNWVLANIFMVVVTASLGAMLGHLLGVIPVLVYVSLTQVVEFLKHKGGGDERIESKQSLYEFPGKLLCSTSPGL